MSGKKQFSKQDDEIRLNKYLAQAGICSRRDADKLIEAGQVTVNDCIAGNGTKVRRSDKVCFNGKIIGGRQDVAVLAYYKPVGVICSERDKHADKLLTNELHYPVRVTYAGRLDKDSEGLLLLTNDGDLIDHLMRGANRHEKEYIVKVKSEITSEFIKSMSEGVYLTDLQKKTRPCQVEQIGKLTFRIILTQGLNRQIRRMCGELGYEVHSLKRVRVANIMLDKLKPGEYRILKGQELQELYDIAGGRHE
ncbi:MAG: pseudouridine synthase [Lachnospiraceae bacterium]|nr:pseudouridine synthase [Lachnospiraceae bacterium]